MRPIRLFRQRPQLRPPRPRVRPQVEPLEARNLLASTLGLTPLVQVSDPSPLPPPASSSPTVFPDSEVEPQIAVDPTNLSHAVAVWQQDRYSSVGGARALVVSVSYDANATDPTHSHWSTPAAIPYFNSTDATNNTIDPVTGQGYARYTDPWVTITPGGDVYVSALAMTPVGPVPGHTAVLVSKSTDGGATWSAPTTLIRDDAPNGTDPADLANDKEMVVADPNDASGRTVYVVWDRLNQPAAVEDFNAAHGLAFREDMMFARTTDGGATWDGGGYPAAVPGYPAADVTNFKANVSAFGNEIVVEPAAAGGNLVDLFTHAQGSGNQAPQADQNHLGVMIGTKTTGGVSWSAITDGPAVEVAPVIDPDTGAPVRDGDPLVSVAVDPNNGNLYAVWDDARFSSKFTYDGIAFSMSSDGGHTWSAPIKVNQTPTTIPAADQQTFTPTVAVAADGTVAVTYYDFRNNDASPGLPTDYWLVHASGNFTDPASWAGSELRLTNTSFNIENAAPTSRGYFLGDYQGLAAAGNDFYALFAQAGGSTSDPSNIWFRDPPPAAGDPASAALAGALAANPSAPAEGGVWSPANRRAAADPQAALTAGSVAGVAAAQPADVPLSGGGDSGADSDVPPDALFPQE